MSRSCSPAHTRRARAIAHAALATITFASIAHAQASARDTTRADTSRVQRMERVMISAVRGGTAAPISQKTLTQGDIAPRYFGQDVPLVLQGAAPSLTTYAETGNYWGYSYIRVRGIDQSRINFTIDGIPLNDPEDQVLYFADFPDLANSLRSIQVQRGVGTSSNGTAAYAGSINMESVPLAATPRGGSVQIEDGSFQSRRGSAEYATGLLDNRFAAYARVSALRTEGYRYHSGVDGRSIFASAGYFGDRDILKFTTTSGTMRDTMAYLAVAESDLDTNRRINPLTKRERDGFTERLMALSYTRLFGPSSSLSVTGYRTSTSGDYDVLIDSLDNFNLKYVWYGTTADWSYRREGIQLDVGANASTYARDHAEYEHPDLVTPLYFNTGHKQDASAFVKLGYTIDRATLFGDVQARRAEFSYTPDAHAGLSGTSTSWTFINPKVGATYAVSEPLSLYISYGKNSREPARSDMFAGFDNLDTSNVADILPLDRVKPETVHDIETGLTYRTRKIELQANLYSMDFRNEIAPIGVLNYIGSPLRKNVGSSYRRGIEADITYRPTTRVTLVGNASASTNRIHEYTDSSGTTPVTYHNVDPLLTPRFITFERAAYDATRALSLAIETRYTGQSFLQNTGDSRYVLPAAFDLSANATIHVGAYELMIRGNNLTDSKKYGSGYASDGVSYYYVLPPRNVFVSLRVAF